MADEGVAVLADDLSGACEVAAALNGLTVLLATQSHERPVDYAVDLGTRESSEQEHIAKLRAEIEAAGERRLFVKLDSLLRGHVASSLAALADRGRGVLFCPALPEHGRTVVDGVLLVNGVPLDRTDAWAREPHRPPRSVADLLTGLPHRPVRDVEEVAGLAEGEIGICDAATSAQAARLAVVGQRAGMVLAGSSAFARGLARQSITPPDAAGDPRELLVLVGSAAPAAHHQAEQLVSRLGAQRIVWPQDPGSPHPQLSVDSRIRVVTIEQSPHPDPSAGQRLVAELAGAVVADDGRRAPDLVLIGGETSRGVLSRLGIERLDVLREAVPGTVVCIHAGRLIVIRPGSFGGVDALVDVVHVVNRIRSEPKEGQDV